MSFGGSAPAPPPPPAPPPAIAQVSPTTASAQTAAAAAAGNMGFNTTVKTGPLGAPPPSTAAKTLGS